MSATHQGNRPRGRRTGRLGTIMAVAAVAALGYLAAPARASATEMPDAAPGTPVVTAVTATTATLAWTPPAAGSVAGYDVIQPSLTPMGPLRLLARTTGPEPTVTLTGLRAGSTTTVYVVARYPTGATSPPSGTATFTTPLSRPPTAPGKPVISQLSATTVRLRWTAATAGDHPIARYYALVNSATVAVPGAGPDTLTMTVYVSPGTTYRIAIVALDTAGMRSAPSEATVFTAP